MPTSWSEKSLSHFPFSTKSESSEFVQAKENNSESLSMAKIAFKTCSELILPAIVSTA